MKQDSFNKPTQTTLTIKEEKNHTLELFSLKAGFEHCSEEYSNEIIFSSDSKLVYVEAQGKFYAKTEIVTTTTETI